MVRSQFMWWKFFFLLLLLLIVRAEEKLFVIYSTCAWKMLLRFLCVKKREARKLFFMLGRHADSQRTHKRYIRFGWSASFFVFRFHVFPHWCVWMCVFVPSFQKASFIPTASHLHEIVCTYFFFHFHLPFGISSTCAALTQISTWSASVRIYLIIKYTHIRINIGWSNIHGNGKTKPISKRSWRAKQ